MASPIYGPIETSPKTTEYPMNASDVFAHAGATFVILGSDGFITPALSGTTKLFGWAIVPKGTGAGTDVDDWKASSTDGKDKLPVVLASDGYTFVAPADASVTAGQAGDGCDLLNASATDSTASLVDIGATSTKVFIIQGLALGKVPGAAATDVLIKVDPAKLQAD